MSSFVSDGAPVAGTTALWPPCRHKISPPCQAGAGASAGSKMTPSPLASHFSKERRKKNEWDCRRWP